MPKTDVVFFKDEKGKVPVLEWLDKLPDKIEAKALVRIEELAQCGHEMRRPHADYLRDGIYELRWFCLTDLPRKILCHQKKLNRP